MTYMALLAIDMSFMPFGWPVMPSISSSILMHLLVTLYTID